MPFAQGAAVLGCLAVFRGSRHSDALDDDLVDRIPPDFNGRLLEEDWPRFEEIAKNSSKRVPVMEDGHLRGLAVRSRGAPVAARGLRHL